MSSDYSHVVEAGLNTIARGDVIKQADAKLVEALESCLDPNTDTKQPRTVTIKISLKPKADRSSAALDYSVGLKLPSDATGDDQIFIRQSDKKGFVPKGEQMSLDATAEERDGVADLDEERDAQ